MKGQKRSEVAEALGACRSAFFAAAAFSLFINLLLLVPSIYMLQIYDRVLGSRNEMTLLVITLVCVALIGVYAALETIRSQILVRIGTKLDELMGGRVFRAVFKISVRRPDSASSQSLRDLDKLREFLTGQGLFAFFDAPWMPIYFGLVFLIHPMLGVVSIIGGLVIFALALANELATRQVLKEATTHSYSASRFVDVSLRNVEALEAMGMLGSMHKRWQAKRGKALGLQAEASDRAGLITAGSKFTRLVLQMAILGVGAYYVLQNEITAGLMIMASIMMGRALQPIEVAVATWRQFLDARTAYARLNELLDAVPKQVDSMPLPAPRGALSVENIIVAAAGSHIPILRGLSFTVAAGDVVGVIGPSAAGKSTLARALVGVWPAYSGTVRIDGADLNSWDRERLGPHIGYLPQDVELFEGTVAENIARFGDLDPDAVVTAASRAGVHQLILNLPKGYDTQIGAGGMTLSGGQRQRIALARALYGDPALLVLDEPNSNLDTEGEAALAAAMAELKARRRTTLVITHRVSILAHVDYIMALSQGVIEKFGTRDQILSQFLKPVSTTPIAAGA
ncbi:MAG TPA: type I secretion system permease/ATPase [Alphaproteobacteria bacterium]|nr:type I secretion system permease/ATPase [Alphaproteobacteria bacterium]